MIGIIFIGDLKYCPYLNKYTEIINQESKEYEVLFWNREGKELKFSSNYISFDKTSRLNKSRLLKSIDFLEFKSWLNRKLKSKNYDKLILLSTLSGIVLTDIILSDYKEKYIFDIRDYSYEYIKPFYKIEEKLIRNSCFTCISSVGFTAFLPKEYPYVISHNFNTDDLEKRKKFVKKKKGAKLNVVFIGAIRYYEHQVKIIKHLKNDDRFRMFFHGSGAELSKFIKFCDKNKVQNIIFTGEYKNSDKYKLLQDADILNNSYKTSKSLEVKYAISNKYYDGLIYGIPQLVETGTYKQKKVESLGLGIGIDENDNSFADKLYNYYFNINEDLFNLKVNEELEKILFDEKKYTQKIKDFILS